MAAFGIGGSRPHFGQRCVGPSCKLPSQACMVGEWSLATVGEIRSSVEEEDRDSPLGEEY